MRRLTGLLLAMTAALAPSTAPAHSPVDHVKRIAQTRVLPALAGTTPAAVPAPGVLACTPRTGSEANQPDLNTSPQTQVIYFVPSGKADQCLDQLELIRSMGSLNAFFVRQGLGELILDKTSTGALDIPFVRGLKNQNGYGSVSDIGAELEQRGYDKSYKRYIIFSADDEGGVCGEAEYPGRFAAFFIDSDPGCGTRDFGDGTLAGAGAAEVISGQEILHNDGVVSLTAPNGCQVSLLHYGHVCTQGGVLVELGTIDPESRDIMFPYALPGMRLSAKVLDRNHDDYFKTGILKNLLFLTDLEDSPYFNHP